jgi:hypothetical protein
VTEYTLDNPEDGCFWRLLGEEEVERFRRKDAADTYGLTKQEALATEGCRALATCRSLPSGSRKVLMGAYREYVLQWRSAKKGQILLLKVSRAGLKDEEYEPLTAGVAVLGEAVVRIGELVDVGEP